MATDFLATGTHPASLVLHGRYSEFLELRSMLTSITILTPVQRSIRDQIVAEIDDINHLLVNVHSL